MARPAPVPVGHRSSPHHARLPRLPRGYCCRIKERQVKDDNGYDPVDCSLHDRLEELATLRQPCELEFATDSGQRETARGIIRDVYTEDGAEYVRLADGPTVRLDRIEAVDGRAYDVS
jgi:Rho-binding antiterminator